MKKTDNAHPVLNLMMGFRRRCMCLIFSLESNCSRSSYCARCCEPFDLVELFMKFTHFTSCQSFLVLGPNFASCSEKRCFVPYTFLCDTTTVVRFLEISDRQIVIGQVNFLYGSFCTLSASGCPLREVQRVSTCFCLVCKITSLNYFGTLFGLGCRSSLLIWTKGHFTPALH